MLIKEDIQALQQYIIGIAFSSLSYGTYVVLLVSAYLIFLKRGSYWVKSHSFLIYMTTCTALTATALAYLDITYYLIVLRWFSGVPQIIQRLNFYLLQYLLSDGVIIWRAWVLFPQHKHVKFILIICTIGSTAGTFVDCILAAIAIFHNPDDDGGKKLNLTMTLPLLATNMISTLLIGFQMKNYYMFNSVTGTPLKARRILILLVESGTIYCLLWPYIKHYFIQNFQCGDAKYSSILLRSGQIRTFLALNPDLEDLGQEGWFNAGPSDPTEKKY
ncbi:hypothetical protein K435DRAFT_806035 [Dendrothele bispora CBS 962.96]|uniref:Uncharacterized protein n=1 Tax=Dendrothele bispora (strain CBS 962.96) TaxID=1314807 RepID=A0A4V4HD01_DENBC|nr:hypothetical protein K435DRAFT_806035 [Dendrothele bispora CBS 962.96]